MCKFPANVSTTSVGKKCTVDVFKDYIDAFEKLMRLKLKDKQTREIIRVLMDCCLQVCTLMYNNVLIVTISHHNFILPSSIFLLRSLFIFCVFFHNFLLFIGTTIQSILFLSHSEIL